MVNPSCPHTALEMIGRIGLQGEALFFDAARDFVGGTRDLRRHHRVARHVPVAAPYLPVVGESPDEEGRIAIERAYVSHPRLISRTGRVNEVFSRARCAAAASCAFANSTLVFFTSRCDQGLGQPLAKNLTKNLAKNLGMGWKAPPDSG
jgi:hypothetical protein